jgi:hypothetical protein
VIHTSHINTYLKPIFQTIYKLTFMTAAKGKGSISWLLLLILVSATASPNNELEKVEMFLGES